MDWFFDIIVLLGTFCVIAIGMTIYAHINPTRFRIRANYIYTGIIPTITISAADSPTKRSPTSLTPADSVEEDEHKSDNSATTPVDDPEPALELKQPENNRLAIPIDDDDDDEEEEQQQSVQLEDTCPPVSLPLVENEEENKSQTQTVRLTSSPVENVEEDEDHSQAITMSKPDEKVKEDKDNSQAMSMSTLDEDVKEDKDNLQATSMSTPNENIKEHKNNSQAINIPSTSFEFENIVEQDKDVNLAASALVEDEKENKQHSKTALLFDKSDEEDHSQTASLSAADSAEDDYSQNMDFSEFDDLSSSPIFNKTDNSAETHASLCKIGTSHTVEEPLFPFSEILEEEHPSARNRFKKRSSQ